LKVAFATAVPQSDRPRQKNLYHAGMIPANRQVHGRHRVHFSVARIGFRH
jgi:hypothetical protein